MRDATCTFVATTPCYDPLQPRIQPHLGTTHAPIVAHQHMIDIRPKERKIVRPQFLCHLICRYILSQPLDFAGALNVLGHLEHSAEVVKVHLPVLLRIPRRDHGRRARLHNRAVEQAPGFLLHAHQVSDRNRAGGLAGEGDACRRAAEVGDVRLHPLEGQDLVLQAPVADTAEWGVVEGVVEKEFCGGQEAEVVGAVVGNDDDEGGGKGYGSCYEIGCIYFRFWPRIISVDRGHAIIVQ